MLLSLDAQGNPSQQDPSKEPHVELQRQQPTLDGHLWVLLSTNSSDFPTTTAMEIIKKGKNGNQKEEKKNAFFSSVGQNASLVRFMRSREISFKSKFSKELIHKLRES